MTHQSNDKAPNGLPSLYDEVVDADTPDKSLSILSAVTGKEVAKPLGHNKTTPRRVAPLFILLIVGMLGFTYWQNSGGEFEAKLATSDSQPPVNKMARPALAVNLPTAASTQAPPQATVHSDAAIIETIREKPTMASLGNSSLPSDLKTTETTNTPVRESPAAKVGAPPSLAIARTAIARTLPIEEKTAKRITEENNNSKVAKTTTPQALPAGPQPRQRTNVSVAQTDPDEKLLEGMLRLMKREPPKDTTHMRSAR